MYLVLFYKLFQTFIIVLLVQYRYTVSIQHPVRLIVDWFFRRCICYFFPSQYYVTLHNPTDLTALHIMSYEFYFKKLRKLSLQQSSTEHHVSNLRAYIANNIIPTGLHIKLTPQNTGWKSNRFLERQDSILFDCSTRLLIILYQNTVHNLEVLDKTITNIKTDLKKSLTFSDTNNINERLQIFTIFKA